VCHYFCGFLYAKQLYKEGYPFYLNALKIALEGLALLFLLCFIGFTAVNIEYPFLGAICGVI